jgi:hypothetical protein
LILSVILIAAGVLRLINFPLLGTKLFTIAFIGVAVAMVVFSVLIMIGLKDSTFSAGSLASGSIGFGAIMNLVCSVLAALGALGAFLLDK